jgi:hypothetical protein
MADGQETLREDLETFKNLLPRVVGEIGRKDLVWHLRQVAPDEIITDDSDGVGLGQLVFVFEDGKLIRVEDL